MSTAIPKLEQIVVATDFSEPAARGLAWGAELARRHGATLHLVHGVVWSAALPPASEGPFLDLRREVILRSRKRLEAFAETVEGPTVQVHADFGQPSDVVLRIAESVGGELIVVGTRGHGALRSLLLGSTAARIVQHSRCDVLSVHPRDAGPPVTDSPSFLLPTDLSPGSERIAVEAVRAFGADPEKTTLRLLHAFPFPAQLELYGLGTQAIAVEVREEERQALEDRLAEIARELREQGFRVEAELVDGTPAASTLEEAERWGADAIAMGTHGRTGLSHLVLGSTAERVVQRAHCPVLTVRRASERREEAEEPSKTS